MNAKQLNTISIIDNAVMDYKKAHEAKCASTVVMLKAIKVSGLTLERKALNAPLMGSVAKAYGITLVTKDRGTGTTWDLNNKNKAVAARHAAAKTCFYAMMGDLFADSVAQSAVDVEFKRAQLAAIKACAALGVTMTMYGQGMKQMNIKAAK
jgi:hypothetical protein